MFNPKLVILTQSQLGCSRLTPPMVQIVELFLVNTDYESVHFESTDCTVLLKQRSTGKTVTVNIVLKNGIDEFDAAELMRAGEAIGWIDILNQPILVAKASLETGMVTSLIKRARDNESYPFDNPIPVSQYFKHPFLSFKGMPEIMPSRKTKIVIGSIFAALLTLMLASFFFTSVAANHVGVKFNRIDGKVENLPLSSGWHLIGFGTSIVEFPTFTQTYTWDQATGDKGDDRDESMNFQVASGVVINSDISISYVIDPSKAPVLYQRYKRGYEEITNQVIRNAVRNALNSYGTQFDAEQLLAGGKIKLAEMVRNDINSKMNPFGIIVEQFGFVNDLRLPKQIQDSINAKIQATQEALKSEALLRKNQADAANAVAVAKGKGDARIIEAEAEAKSLEVVGKSIREYGADAARLKNQSRWIDKWDGKMPTTQLGGETNAMISVK